ncbi:glycosyltransferase, partial [Patescibacteria group bacterium]|nr:glycosyltransferase [Patescibacteria group bacterium]
YLRWLKYRLAVKIVDKVVQRYLNFMFTQCDLVLAPSKMLVEELNRDGFKKPVSYLPNGVISRQSKSLSEKEKANIRKKYGLQEKVVLHFGRLSHEKNVDLLIKSFHLLTKHYSNISLLVIGDGPTKKRLIKLARKLGIEREVVFTGFIEHQKLISSGLLNTGDIFVTTSTMENNPMQSICLCSYSFGRAGGRNEWITDYRRKTGRAYRAGFIKWLSGRTGKYKFICRKNGKSII